jgi:ribosomal protein S18 acetylase RimI-like enzyme
VSDVWLATVGEAETVAELLTEFRDHQGHSWPSAASFLASVELLIGTPDTEFWLAATDEGQRAAGICQLRFRHSVWTGTEDCWLEDLFVRSEARRRGIARALVEHALERARERGCRRIELDTNEDNHPAIALYESVGFSSTSKGKSRSLYLGARLPP